METIPISKAVEQVVTGRNSGIVIAYLRGELEVSELIIHVQPDKRHTLVTEIGRLNLEADNDYPDIDIFGSRLRAMSCS